MTEPPLALPSERAVEFKMSAPRRPSFHPKGEDDHPARQPMSQNAVSSRVAATKVVRSCG